MTIYDIFISQLSDPFRIGLLIALLVTTRNTFAHTGAVLPLLAGVVFVAILIPLTFSADAENWWMLVGVGLLSNCVVVAIAVGLWLAFTRLSSRKEDGR